MGTVGYMSPEQASGQPVDFRSDQFSFGAILYEMATGKRAFERETAVQTLSAIIQEEPEPLGSQQPEGSRAAALDHRAVPRQGARRTATARRGTSRATSRRVRDRLSEASLSGAVLAAEPARPGLRIRKAVLAFSLLAALLAGAWPGGFRRVLPFSALRFRQVTFGNFTISQARFAPDGQTVVYSVLQKGGVRTVDGARRHSRVPFSRHSKRGDSFDFLAGRIGDHPRLEESPTDAGAGGPCRRSAEGDSRELRRGELGSRRKEPGRRACREREVAIGVSDRENPLRVEDRDQQSSGLAAGRSGGIL